VRNLWSNLKRLLNDFLNTAGSSGNTKRSAGGSASTSSGRRRSKKTSVETTPIGSTTWAGLEPGDRDIAERLVEEKEAFENAGGIVVEFDPEPTNRSKFDSVSPRTGSKADKLSGYAQERRSKSESLSTRLNLKSVDFQNVPGGGGAEKLEVGEIAAAFAMGSKCKGGLTNPQQDLIIYYHTTEECCRSAAWAYLMTHLAGVVVQEKWGTRKKGILQKMAFTVLDELMCPPKFRTISDRQWAGKLGLANHSHWRTYKPRYKALLNHAKEIINHGDEVLNEQL